MVDASDHSGWSSENNPWGGNSGGTSTGNGNNGGNNGSGGNSSTPDGKTLSVFGMAAFAVPVNGVWGVTLFDSAAIAGDLAAALAALEKALPAAPYAARMAGMFGLLAPSPLGTAKVDINVNSLVMTALPADKVLSSPVTTLPTQPATVQVNKRITDEVVDGRQHLVVSAVKGLPQSVPVVDAKPTGKPGVYSAAVVPGLSPMQISISKGKPAGIKPSGNAISSEGGPAVPSGFTGNAGTYDAIVRFPAESKTPPVYVSVTDVLSAPEIKKREDDEKARRAAWDAAHPVEVAQRELDAADKDLKNADTEIKRLQDEVEKNKKSVESFKRAIDSPVRDPLFRITADNGYKYSVAKLAENEKSLAIALESRKEKDKKKKDAEAKLDAEKKKPRKGMKEAGHDYHQPPDTKDIKGLGELVRGEPRTPKQGGAGKRPRWFADKGRKVYEWDSKKGELEGYRTSDGSHLGAFDPDTGVQIGKPIDKRNIKQYL